MLVAVAVKLSTPPEGVITVLVGEDGTAEAGPRVLEVLGASHTGLTSAVVGAATLPAIWGVTTDWAWLVPTKAAVSEAASTVALNATTASRRGCALKLPLPCPSTPVPSAVPGTDLRGNDGIVTLRDYFCPFGPESAIDQDGRGPRVRFAGWPGLRRTHRGRWRPAPCGSCASPTVAW
jgi:hypothetical protein